jgi:hypothetical protein
VFDLTNFSSFAKHRPNVECQGYFYEAARGGLSLQSRLRKRSTGINPRADLHKKSRQRVTGFKIGLPSSFTSTPLLPH